MKINILQITYRSKIDQDRLLVYFNEYDYSPIEDLIIVACFSDGSLNNLLYYFPKFLCLLIDYVIHSHYEDIESCPIRLFKYLKYVSFQLYPGQISTAVNDRFLSYLTRFIGTVLRPFFVVPYTVINCRKRPEN